MATVEGVIDRRRSLRALDAVDLAPRKLGSLRELADALTSAARLAPSADNRQPWRFVSVYEEPQITQIRNALSPLNQWASACSLFIVVCASPTSSLTGPSDSGRNGPINYYLYDTGLASAFLMLRASDFELVAHPIAGFDSGAVADAIGLKFASTLQIVAMIAIGQKSSDRAAVDRIPEKMRPAEKTRPERMALAEIAFHNSFPSPAAATSQRQIVAEDESNFDRDVILINDDGKIYHLDQSTLDAMTSVDEMSPEDQVAYGFIHELVDLGISTAAVPNIPSMNASIFCYLLNLGSLIPPDKKESRKGAPSDGGMADAAVSEELPQPRRAARKRPHMQYSGCKPE